MVVWFSLVGISLVISFVDEGAMHLCIYFETRNFYDLLATHKASNLQLTLGAAMSDRLGFVAQTQQEK